MSRRKEVVNMEKDSKMRKLNHDYVGFEDGKGSQSNQSLRIKILTVALILCIIIAIIFIILYSIEVKQKEDENSQKSSASILSQQGQICNSYHCVQTASSE